MSGSTRPPASSRTGCTGPDLLAFAGIDPVVVPALPLEFAVAEKVHAYTRAYGDRMLASTRVKDLVDLVLIAGEAALDVRRLREALEVTFDRRATHPLPARLPRPAADWRVPYGRMCRDIGLEPDLGAGHELAALLVDPVLAGEVVAGTWDPAAAELADVSAASFLDGAGP